MTDTAVAMADTADEPRRAFTYDGTFGRLAKICTIAALLGIVTLSIYRFWGRTRFRRYVWSRVSLDGDRFEYTGTGEELFFGFLKVVALVVAATVVIGIPLAVIQPGPLWLGLFQLLEFAAFYGFYHAAIYFSRRYRLSRTGWRSVRAGLSPCFWRYAQLTIGYQALSCVTLGLSAPFGQVAIERLLLNHTWMGDTRAACDAPSSGLLVKYYLPVWALWIVGFVASIAAVIGLGLMTMIHVTNGDLTVDALPKGSIWLLVLFILLLVLSVPLYVRYRLAILRHVLGSTRFGTARLAVAPVSGGAIVKIALATLAVPLAVLILVTILSSGAFIATGASQVLLLLATIPALVVIGAGGRWLSTLLWTHTVMSLVIPKLSLAGDIDFAAIGRSTIPAPRHGEGLADMFDIAG